MRHLRASMIFVVAAWLGTHMLAADAPIALVIHSARPKGTFAITVSGKTINSTHLLDAMNDLVMSQGHNVPVAILIHEDVPLSRMFEAKNAAEKAGFLNVRCYYFRSTKGTMSPITFGRPLPFTLSPP